jgi:hypothetical protein
VIRGLAGQYGLFKRDETEEYYQGLTLYLLGALKFGNLDRVPEAPLPKQVAFWGAAVVQALLGLDSCPELSLRQRVQIYIQGELPLLSAERQKAIIDALAGLMGIASQEIQVYRIYAGSIVFDLGIPENGVQHLRSLLQSNSAQLRLLKIEKIIFEPGVQGKENWLFKNGIFRSSEMTKRITERKTIMTDKEIPNFGATIGNVTGGIHGTIIAGRDVKQTTITSGGQQATTDKGKPTLVKLKQLLTEVRQELATVTANQEALKKISDDNPSLAGTAETIVRKAAEKIEQATILEPEEAEAIEKSLKKASSILSSILDEAKSVAQKAGEVGQTARPIAEKLESVIKKLDLAVVWVVRL